MTKTTTEAFISQLTPSEQDVLYAGLIKRERENVRSMAVMVSGLLRTYLEFLGRVEPRLANDAQEVARIMSRLNEKFDNLD